MTCAFCPATEDLETCDFPEWKEVELPIEQARVGDTWITDQQHKRARIVEVLNVLDDANSPCFQIWVLIPGHPRPYPYYRWPRRGPRPVSRAIRDFMSTFLTEKDANCGAPACELHRCERGPGATCCADHWRELSSFEHF